MCVWYLQTNSTAAASLFRFVPRILSDLHETSQLIPDLTAIRLGLKMGVKIAAGNCLRWSLPSLPHSSSSPQTLASTVSSKRRGTDGFNRSLYCSIGQQSPFLGSVKLSRRQSLEDFRQTGWRSKGQSFRKAYSACMGGFAEDDKSDEEFIRRLQELALELQHNCDNIEHLPDSRALGIENTSSPSSDSASLVSSVRSEFSPSAEPPWSMTRPELPEWVYGDEIAPASVEMKANRVDLPLSLRIIKRKKRWEEGLKEAGESACCSIKKAFSSMVFIVRELQSYTLQMREVLFYENLQGILARVQGEMNASFVWLFQQIFSCTPTFMVYVMLLLANFTVYSIGRNSAIAAVSPNPPVVVEQHYEHSQHQNPRLDTSSIKSFSVGRTASVGGGGGGGGKVRPVAGATGDGQSDGSHSTFSQTIIPADGISKIGSEGLETMMEEETAVWNRIVEEASRMQASSRDEALMQSDTLQQLVSPVTIESEPDDYADYLQTELMYHKALSKDPDNVLLLSNFAQFLFLVLHDHDRAEYYFKRAARVKPGDAEALCRFAMFLWLGKDLEAAEEAYLEAIAADPSNAHYAANYAHFLWNTGGEDTCYPLDGSDAC